MRNLLAICVLVPGLLSAAEDPFLGTWILNPQKTKPGKGVPPPPPGVKLVYEKLGKGVRVTTIVPMPESKKRVMVHTQIFDGQPRDRYEGKPPNGETVAYRRIDERTEEATWRKDGKLTHVTLRTISPDGRTLTAVTREASHPEPVGTLVYDRQ